ncbi:MAG: class I SAM-dependent methyltransferase, partial [Bacteroidota bacterium]
LDGESLLDMTGGFGVDTYHFSKKMEQVTYLEKNAELFYLVKHNFQVLKASNITAVNDDSTNFLAEVNQSFDWIYLDPARRDEAGGRKIGLAGYFPNLLAIRELLFKKTKKVLVKASPMLDIQQAIEQLKTVEKVIVLAVQNEVKELLLLLSESINNDEIVPTFQAVNLKKNGSVDQYQPSINQRLSVDYGYPRNYIYEPNAAILKAGLFKEIALDFKLAKLHTNTHLYTSDHLLRDFPGRIFICRTVERFHEKAVAVHLDNKKANITTRNFPYSVAQIKKKLGTKDGGKRYLFATTLYDGNLAILICEKVS